MTLLPTAIGYIRVSTDKQNVEGHALERQARKIREACETHGTNLAGIYEDVGSAVGKSSIDQRPALNDALSHAARVGGCLIVTEPTRLFRNVKAAELWLSSCGVSIFSVHDNKILDRSEILAAVTVGAENATASSNGTIKALEAKRAAGVTLGSPADRSAANAASKRARAIRSNTTVVSIALIMREDVAYQELSNRAFADLLNRRNVLTGWGRAWTTDGLKRQRKLAMELLNEWIALESEPETSDLSDVAAGQAEVSLIVQQPDAPVIAPALPLSDEEAMRQLPTFGMF
jgi:DNA invertase Pin-like site-specific DNA recombinase